MQCSHPSCSRSAVRFYVFEDSSQDERCSEHQLSAAWLIADSHEARDFDPAQVPPVDWSTVERFIGSDVEEILNVLGFIPFSYRDQGDTAEGVIVIPNHGYLFRQEHFDQLRFILNSLLPFFQCPYSELEQWIGKAK